MSDKPPAADRTKVPTLTAAAIFRFKSFLLQLRRLLADVLDPHIKKAAKGGELADRTVIAESKSPLWTETDVRERSLVAGKIQNLRLAVAAIDGAEFAANEIFSFWKNVGRANRRRGFVAGRELREGCIIPNVGGGLCQLSNALYDAALKANLEIVERHPHTAVVPGSHAEEGRDATVFWNYIDLRFRSRRPFRIDAKLSDGHLAVQIRGERADPQVLHPLTRHSNGNGHVSSCMTCGVEECFRAAKPTATVDCGRTAFLVDEFVPEFDQYMRSVKGHSDLLFLPINGDRFRRANYAWTTAGFENVEQTRYLTLQRSFRSRRLAAQGAARQRNLLEMYERLARSYARRLPFDALHIVVQQQLLPFLWRDGHLGGRTFDVMMTALPMAELQLRLDSAYELHPRSTTLSDFRADPAMVAAEKEALAAARLIITSHTEVARLFPGRVERLQWAVPLSKPLVRRQNEKPVIVFPASTVGRKGCYELREAIRGLKVRLLTLGPDIESADFWHGFDVERGSENWLATADIVALPAFVEHRPRRLLQAVAHGIPVIASSACGVGNVDGITPVEAGDATALRQAVETLI